MLSFPLTMPTANMEKGKFSEILHGFPVNEVAVDLWSNTIAME